MPNFSVGQEIILPGGAFDPHTHCREPGATDKENWRQVATQRPFSRQETA